MPQVPVYNEFQVRSTPLQPVMQQAVDVSSGANAMAKGLSVVSEAADKIDLRDAQDAAFKAQYQLRNDWDAYSAKLREAYKKDQADVYKAEADKWWEQARQKYTAEMNPRAQALAGQAMGMYELQQRAATTAYVEREKAQAREINFKTLQSTQMREALQSATPENATAIASTTAEVLRKNAQQYATANGLGSEVGEAMARESIDHMHKSIALTLASRPDGLAAAQDYITKNSKDMLPADRDAVNRQVELTAKQAQVQRESQASDTAWQLFAQGKPIPGQVLGQMDGRERYQLQEAQRTRAERLAAGKPVKTDVKQMAALLDMAREEPEKFATLKLSSLTEKIAGTDIEQLATLQRAMVKDKAVVTSAQLVGSYSKGMPTPKKAAFEQTFYNELLAFKEKNNRTPTDKEQKAIIDDLMLRRDNSWWQFGDKAKWEMSDEDRASATFKPGPTASKTADQFTPGQVYRDKNGNRAEYLGNGKWKNL